MIVNNGYVCDWGKKIESADKRIISNFLVAEDVVDDRSEFSVSDLPLVLVEFLHEVGNGIVHLELVFNLLILASALVLSGVTDDGVSSLPVVADGSEASWEEGNGISSDVDSGGFDGGVEPFCPLLVSNSRCSEGNNLHIVEFLGGQDVNVTEGGESSSKADTGDDESPSMNLRSESSKHIRSDSVPHAVVLTLHLASLGGLLVLSLSLMKNLPGRPRGDPARRS